MAKDFYSTLGVPRTATEKEIRSAYRKAARKHHPDVNPGDKAAEARFKEINTAYEVLSDAEKRKKYDKYGDRWEYADQIEEMERTRASRPFARNGGSYTFDVNDLGDMGDLGGAFSQFFGRSRGGARAMTRRGADIQQPVEVTLEEAYHGTTRVLQMAAQEPCPTCGGAGVIAGATCHACNGAGVIVNPRRLEVKIPAGVANGSKVRVAGEGQPGYGGGRKGDMILVVTVRPHARFERKGDDLIEDVDVPVTTAALGGEVEVPTVTGRVMLKIPPMTQSGRTFKLAGLGMPRLAKTDRGDLHARVRIRLPQDIDDRQRALFEQLRETGV